MYPLPRKIASWHSALALVALVLTPSMALAGKVDEQTYVSVKKINETKVKKTLASPRTKSSKPEHFWDEGSFKNAEDSTFTGFR